MTETGAKRWYERPAIVLPAFGVLTVAVALIAREPLRGRAGDPRLSTFSTQPQGAQLLYEAAQRLGWSAERRVERDPPEGTALIHAVLDPAEPLRATEVHTLLERVRAGAALLVVVPPGEGSMTDSLGIEVDSESFYRSDVRTEGTPLACATDAGSYAPLWPDDRAHLYALRWRAAAPGEVETFAWLEEPETADTRPAVLGFPLERGRVVVVSDADVLRNDALRACHYGLDVAAVRALEFLGRGGDAPRRTLVFDEYHQGYGDRPGALGTILGFLRGTGPGRALLQIAAAGLLLLAAAAPRMVPPRTQERIERRSPFEHVDALARAYGSVGATRTVTSRLLAGVRRRREQGAGGAGGEHGHGAFLDRVDAAQPALRGDTARIRRALERPISPSELEQVGAALERIEHFLKRV